MILDLPLERWRRIEPILDRILDLPPAERDEALDTACDGDPALRAEVEAFLAADEAAGGFLDTPAGEYAVDLLDEEAGDLPAGGQIGPYRLVREIGSGGMGVVYEAEDSRLRRRVAIKFLPPEYSRDRRAKERFLREARAASCLDHPNLCTVYDVGESDGRVYIVLAYYEGETLKERLRRGPLPIAEARDVAIQVARGLACAHEAGIIHRDIKPANVMLTRRGEVKILDFGVAKQGGEDISLTPTGGSLGTPAYMSPEQVQGEAVDGRTDVWSLGVMLYEMLAGRRPFGGEGVQAVLSAILTREPEPLERLRPEVPPALARVVERALAKNPAERYGSAVELLADLERGRAPKASLRIRRLRRMKALPAGLAAAAVLALLAAAWIFGFAAKPQLRVAVLYPEVIQSRSDPEVSFFASDIVDATLSTLLTLEGIQPLDPPDPDEGLRVEISRESEADEVLNTRLECLEGWCRVTWRRSKPGGKFLGKIGPIEIQTGIDNVYQLAEAVQSHLPKLYGSGHPLRADAPGEVNEEDYEDYIELESQFDRTGRGLGPADLERLDALQAKSPNLVGAYLLAAGIAHNLGDQDRALEYAARAEKIDQRDPRSLLIRVRIEAAEGQLAEAEATLERLSQLAPNDARIPSAKADLLEERGLLKEAWVLRDELARRRPHWTKILDLVTLEFRMGESESARRRLDDLLRAQPENLHAKERLAMVGTVYGDPRRAAELYEEVIAIRPTDQCWANLGFARFVLGDYAAAEGAFHNALELQPDYPLTRYNLAAVLDAQGDKAGARQLCATLVKEFEANPTQFDATIGLLNAQCLARLDREEDAIRLANRVLEESPEEDIQIFFRAAQLYALMGPPHSALHYAGKALEKGMRSEWFTLPEFRSLEKDPEFRALLGSSAQGLSRRTPFGFLSLPGRRRPMSIDATAVGLAGGVRLPFGPLAIPKENAQIAPVGVVDIAVG